MNVTVTTPNPAFTGNVSLQDGAVVLGFTAGTTGSIDVPPSAFGAITNAGLTITIGTPSPGPGYDANLDQVVAPLVGAGASATSAALRAALVPKWKASTAYASGEFVLNPSGQIVSANTAFTSGTTYSATNWTVVSGGGSTNVLGSAENPVTNAAAARPTGFTKVFWQTATQPTNWASGDEWINNS